MGLGGSAAIDVGHDGRSPSRERFLDCRGVLCAPISDERGAILPLMALLLVVLLGTAAMAVDLGWLLYHSLEIQHGADAAALAGVIHVPDGLDDAEAEALASAAENGYDAQAAGTSVSVIDYIDDPTLVDHNGQLRVAVTHSVDTFFLPIFGMDDVDIARTAVAEYVRPLALGSPESYFGNDPARGIEQGLWGSIHGTYTRKRDGDRFATLCDGAGSGSGCPPNPEARPAVGWGDSVFYPIYTVTSSVFTREELGPAGGSDNETHRAILPGKCAFSRLQRRQAAGRRRGGGA